MMYTRLLNEDLPAFNIIAVIVAVYSLYTIYLLKRHMKLIQIYAIKISVKKAAKMCSMTYSTKN